MTPSVNDCWNKIGVRGDQSCPELVEYIHCRNCPVHAAAAATILDAMPPAEYLDESTRHYAGEKIAEASNTSSILIFRIGAEWLALPMAVVDEIADWRAIHSIPHHKGGIVSGLVNVRGELLVCVSLAGILHLEKSADLPQDRRHVVYRRLLVIRGEGGRLAFPVDEVHGVHRFNPQDLQSVPATVAKATATYARGMLPWREKAVGCLDDRLLLYALNRRLE
ncbi:MAG: chemotaxis protein CheW [Pseudomonadota bacterium]